MKRIKLTSIILAVLLLVPVISSCGITESKFSAYDVYDDVIAGGAVSLQSGDDFVSVENGFQKVSFTKNDKGNFVLSTYVKTAQGEKKLFGAEKPLIEGTDFGSYPTSYEITKNTSDEKVITLKGHNDTNNYDFDIVVTASEKTELIHVVITNHLTENLVLKDKEPRIMLTMDGKPSDLVTVFMQSPSYTYVDDRFWGAGFPYAYMWTGGAESGIFFDMETMDWFSFKTGIERFTKVQVRTTENTDGSFAMGMDVRKESAGGKYIAKGDMVCDFYLYGKEKETAPSKIEALGTAVNAFGVCFPNEVSWPSNFVDEGMVSHEYFCQKISEQLSIEYTTYAFSRYNGRATWNEGPGLSNQTLPNVLIRPSVAIRNGKASDVKSMSTEWNCTNNSVVILAGFNRLFPIESTTKVLEVGLPGLKTYLDGVSFLIRSFSQSKGSGSEFTFQNFFFGMSTLKAAQLMDPAAFDPGIPGAYLIGLEGVLKIGEQTDHIMPHMFSASDYADAVSIDYPDLGKLKTPWSVGIYAYDMCMAHEYTGQQRYLDEAIIATERLFKGDIAYEQNGVTISDPYDFGVNESSDAPWGVAAAQYLYKVTGEDKYLTYSDHFKSISLRLMNWYESKLRDNEQDQYIGSAGLFAAFSQAYQPTSWETAYCYLPLTAELKNEDIKQSKLMLNMFNQNRANSLHFSIATYDAAIMQAANKNQMTETNYLVSEAFFSAEQGSQSGMSGPCVYMSNSEFYNYFMYEAFATSRDKDIMVLNLDMLDTPFQMMNGTERNFIVYNGTEQKKTFTLNQKFMQDAKYEVTVTDSIGKAKTYNKDNSSFEKGLKLTLQAGDYLRIKTVLADAKLSETFENTYTAQKKLALCYSAYQGSAIIGGFRVISEFKEEYLAAVELYNNGNYTEAIAACDALYPKLQPIYEEQRASYFASRLGTAEQ